jgi:protocatechuate 3,4-dioxygenase beta subunit
MVVGDHDKVWRTSNGGAEWEVNTTLGGYASDINLTGVTRHPSASDTFMAVGSKDPTVSGALPKALVLSGQASYTIPAAPSGLSVVATSPGPAARLAWTDNAKDEVRFDIERAKDSPTGTYSVVGTAPAGSTSYVDSAGLDWSSTWYYRVRAWNQQGYSATYTGPVGVTKLDTTPPTVSSDATTTPYVGSATIHITANDAQSGVSRIVYRLGGGSETSASVVPLGVGTWSLDYRALDAAGNWSGFSAPVTINVIPFGTLSGKVTELDGTTPIGGVSVAVGGTWSATTIADGTYSVTGITPGTYSVVYAKADHVTNTQTDVVIASGANTRNVSLTANPGTLSGRVTKTDGTTPIGGVSVQVGSMTAVLTDGNGDYSVTGIAPAAYSVVFSKLGYDTVTQGGVVILTGFNPLSVSLSRTPGTLSGTVRSTAGGGTLSGASVKVSGMATATTDVNGVYSIAGIAPETYTVVFSKAAFATGTRTGVVVDSGPNFLDVSLTPDPVTLSGTVTRVDGTTPIDGVSVKVSGMATVTTGAGGTYSVTGITPGTYTVVYSKSGYVTKTDSGVTINPGETTFHDVSLTSDPASLTTVWRFYNFRQGVHFYTASATERDNVQSTLGGTYNYEGPAYTFDGSSPAASQNLYRFYNFRKGVHFYTASDAEMVNVRDNLTGTYRLEGVAYKVSPGPVPGAMTVWRFYNFRQGVHFYTASAAEMANVRDTLGGTYRLEGVAFYLPQ